MSTENSSNDGVLRPGGTFSQLTGSTACSNCSLGKSHTVIGAESSTKCVPCGRGRYFSLTENGTQCVMCPAGKYINIVGSTAVSDCLDCASESLIHSLTEGFKCSSMGQSVPFVQSGFYRNKISLPFNI